jgi:hypothetical protein
MRDGDFDEVPASFDLSSSPRSAARAARYLVAPAIGLLKDVLGYLPAPGSESYRSSQSQRAEHDQERRRRQRHRYPELRDSREDRVDDDRVPRHARQEIAARRPRTIPETKFASSAARIRIRIAAMMLDI